MKFFWSAFVLVSAVGCASTSSVRGPASVRDYTFDMRAEELRETPAFANPTDKAPYETLAAAFTAGTAATLDEVFPTCLAKDGVTVTRLSRQATRYVKDEARVVQNDGGHQYCRYEFDIEVAPAQAATGPLFPARPAKVERWFKVVRARVANAPFPLSPGDNETYRKQTKESPTICKAEADGTLFCKDLLDESIKKVFARRDVSKPDGPAAYVMNFANLDSATVEAKGAAYVYIWEDEPAAPAQ